MAIADALIGCFQWKYKDVNGGPVTNTERPITYIRGVIGILLTGSENLILLLILISHQVIQPQPAQRKLFLPICLGKIMTSSITRMIIWVCHHRSYSSFSDMAEQIGMSRVYAGIHTRYACEVGRTQGEKIAENLDKLKFLKD